MYFASSIYSLVVIASFIDISDQRSVSERGAMSYVVERGCPFLAHYVRENYFDYDWLNHQPSKRDSSPTTTVTIVTSTLPVPRSTTTHINWVFEVYKRFTADYVPMELFKGLMNCGKEYALYSINAPSNLTQALNIDYSSVPGIGFILGGAMGPLEKVQPRYSFFSSPEHKVLKGNDFTKWALLTENSTPVQSHHFIDDVLSM